MITAPVGELLAAELQCSPQRRVEGANADAVLKVLDRAPPRVLIPQVVQLVSAARAEQGRAGPCERVGIRQAVIDYAGPFDRAGDPMNQRIRASPERCQAMIDVWRRVVNGRRVALALLQECLIALAPATGSAPAIEMQPFDGIDREVACN